MRVSKYRSRAEALSFLTNFTLFFGRLDGVKYENGKINVVNRKTGNKPKFSQKKWYVAHVSSGSSYKMKISEASGSFVQLLSA